MSEKPSIESVFCAAIEIESSDERQAYLDRTCGEDQELRRQAERLLRAHFQGGSILDSPARGAEATVERPVTEKPGTVIGPYKLLQKIGEGGFGVVYMADQTKPVKRRVALKIIKPGMDSGQVIARFEAERQALAMMDHPNIAKVLDAGTTDTGRPYFVMELVKGLPITQFCDEKHLTPRERLELFVPVCQALQHAHQKGVIHRDIKPSNVLVAEYDDRAVPKIIDFGVAKAIEQPLTEKTMFTQLGQVVGTVEYMSPEQAKLNQLDIDTRSDVYSLGVLLYELLTGEPAFDRQRLRSAAFDELLRIIREEEPPKPSTRLSTSQSLPTIAINRHTEPKKLSAIVRGELDWIVMKALEKDRTRRYETANGLARDIERYLNDESVTACPPSPGYRLRKFARRNKVTISMLGLMVATLLLGTVVSTWQAIRATWWARLADERLVGERRAHEEAARAWKQAEQARAIRNYRVPEIRRLMDEGYQVAAFNIARKSRETLPDDPVLADLWDQLTVNGTIDTNPRDAQVKIKDWQEPEDVWTELGRTPITSELPRGMLRWRIEKEGYVCIDQIFSVSNRPKTVDLISADVCPEEMVRVTAGIGPRWARLGAGDRRSYVTEHFFVDKFEVSNAEYLRFIEQGAYQNREYWEHLIADVGQDKWQEVVRKTFVDETGNLGPSTWTEGRYPRGEGDFPVRGVSWYEAVAYTKSNGKDLPTVWHWGRAADYDNAPYIVPLSNFSNEGPAARATFVGTGSFGAMDMAGNVKEWCWNTLGTSRRCTLGGAWNEPEHQFVVLDAYSPFDRLSTLGFRSVKYDKDVSAKALAGVSMRCRDYFKETPATEEEVESLKRAYKYADTPLNSEEQLREVVPEGYVHEVIVVDTAYGNERLPLHLYLPRDVAPPYQTIVFYPGYGAVNSRRFRPTREVTGIVALGRAVVFPVYQGTFERDVGFDFYACENQPILHRDYTIQMAKDLCRAVDYLQERARTKKDIDMNKLAYVGTSWGAGLGPIMTVIKTDFQACVLIRGGLWPWTFEPEVDPFNFLTYMNLPVLMVNGKYDQTFPSETSQRPMYELLRNGKRELKWVRSEANHAVPLKDSIDAASSWLNEHLGPVQNDCEDAEPPNIGGP